MAFDFKELATVGAQASAAPKLYSYRSDDTLADVSVAGYWVDKEAEFDVGDWIISVLSDGNVLLQVLADTSSVVPVQLAGIPADNFTGGFFNYHDLATATTPISLTGGTGPVKLTNDEQGALTSKDYPPLGVTDFWNSSTNQFDWTELSLGDMVDLRMDIKVTTTSPNQVIDVFMVTGVGGTEQVIPFASVFVKTTGTVDIGRYNGGYMGDLNTLNNPSELRIQSDGNATVQVIGWYIKAIKQGA